MVFCPCSENKASFLSLSRFFQQRDCTITGSCTEENVDAIVNTDLEEHLLSPSGQAVVLKDYPAHIELRRSKVSTSTSGMPAPMEAHQSGEMVFQLKIIFWAHFTDVYIQCQNCISHGPIQRAPAADISRGASAFSAAVIVGTTSLCC